MWKLVNQGVWITGGVADSSTLDVAQGKAATNKTIKYNRVVLKKNRGRDSAINAQDLALIDSSLLHVYQWDLCKMPP